MEPTSTTQEPPQCIHPSLLAPLTYQCLYPTVVTSSPPPPGLQPLQAQLPRLHLTRLQVAKLLQHSHSGSALPVQPL